jgi:glycosyltransferase involved in cell wall biosynthesis
VAVGQARPSAERAGPGTSSPPDLADALHALAQLPEDVGLELRCDERALRRLELVAWAYGLEGRADLRAATGSSATWLRGAERIPRVPSLTIAEEVEGLWPAGCESSLDGGDDEVLAGHRIAVVSNLPAHYRIPLFAGLSRRLEAVGASLRVLFLRSSAGRRTWLHPEERFGFDHEILGGIDLPVRRRPPRLPLGLTASLRRFRPTLAVAAGFSPAVSGRVQRYARKAGIPFGVWSGETAALAARHPRVRQAQRRRLTEAADFGIAYGALAARYLASLAPRLPVAVGRNTSVLGTSEAARTAGGRPVELLAVGDLTSARKGADVLVSALRAVADQDCRLTVVGGGRVRKALEREAAGDARIRFTGSLPPPAVRDLLDASDVFLFPSREDVFGLVLVEAMSRGLAIGVSSAVGAVPDVAVPGRNCLVVDGHDPPVWAEAIAGLAGDPELRVELGNAAVRTIARRWTMDHAVEGSLAGLRLGARLALEGGRPG